MAEVLGGWGLKLAMSLFKNWLDWCAPNKAMHHSHTSIALWEMLVSHTLCPCPCLFPLQARSPHPSTPFLGLHRMSWPMHTHLPPPLHPHPHPPPPTPPNSPYWNTSTLQRTLKHMTVSCISLVWLVRVLCGQRGSCVADEGLVGLVRVLCG